MIEERKARACSSDRASSSNNIDAIASAASLSLSLLGADESEAPDAASLSFSDLSAVVLRMRRADRSKQLAQYGCEHHCSGWISRTHGRKKNTEVPPGNLRDLPTQLEA